VASRPPLFDHAAYHGDDHDTDENPELALTGGAYIADFLS
jgi:hypothetical protein